MPSDAPFYRKAQKKMNGGWRTKMSVILQGQGMIIPAALMIIFGISIRSQRMK